MALTGLLSYIRPVNRALPPGLGEMRAYCPYLGIGMRCLRGSQPTQLALSKEQSDTQVNRSNRGGWLSDIDLFDWGEPAIQTLKQRV